MPSPISSSSSIPLINSLTGTRNARGAGAIQDVLDQVRGTGKPENVAISFALDKARTAQQAVASARDAGKTLDSVRNTLTQMRDLAAKAASTADPAQRGKLATEFNKLQGEVNDIGASKVAFNGKPALAGINGTQNAATTGVQISGRGNVNGHTFTAAPQAVGQSQVAAANGVKDVQVADKNANSRFSFIDLGNGKISAIRYDKGTDGIERQVSSQTVEVAAPEKGKTTTANFDKIGVKVTLDDRYAAGELQGTEVRSGPQAAAATTGGGDQVTKFAMNINDQGKAGEAVKAIDTALARVGNRQNEIEAFQRQQSRTIRDSFALIAGAGRGNRQAINTIG